MSEKKALKRLVLSITLSFIVLTGGLFIVSAVLGVVFLVILFLFPILISFLLFAMLIQLASASTKVDTSTDSELYNRGVQRNNLTVDDKIDQLKMMYNKGRISEEEFDRRLDGLLQEKKNQKDKNLQFN